MPSGGDGGSGNGGSGAAIFNSASSSEDSSAEEASTGEGASVPVTSSSASDAASGASTSNASSASSGAGGHPPIEYAEQVCPDFCDAATAGGCAPHPSLGCLEFCEADVSEVDDCDIALATYFQCEGDHFVSDGCAAASAACSEFQRAYLDCVFPPDGDGLADCSREGDTNVCTTTSSEHTFTSECETTPTSYSCSCYVDDEVVGSCIGDVTDELGCCRSWFSRTL